MSLARLKSGSDLRGVAIALPGQAVTLTPELVRRAGAAFAALTARHAGKPAPNLRFAVGRDSRLSGETLAEAMMRGLAAAGAQVLDAGLCTTPAMYMTTLPGMLGVDGAVMITASHHPWTRNGCKFFWPEGGLDAQDLQALIDLAEGAPDPGEGPTGALESPFLPTYAAFLRGILEDPRPGALPLSKLHFMVDAGNGAGGFYADILREVGADTEGSQYLEPDGRFLGHIPNPEDETAMASAGAMVRRCDADLGILFDADCDRAAIVDGQGSPVNRNRLVALTCAMVLDEHPGATIVTDSVTSLGLTRYIEGRGGRHHRFRRGYRNVIDEAKRLGQEGVDCPLAIETSGHAAFRENHFLDDGMYLVTRLIVYFTRIAKDGRDPVISTLLRDLPEPVEEVEIRLPITSDPPGPVGLAALEALTAAARQHPGWATDPTPDGQRVIFTLRGEPKSGCVMLRQSVHDPVLALNAESYVQGGLEIMLRAVLTDLESLPGVDFSPLVDFLTQG